MESITFGNVQLEGVAFTKLLNVEIKHVVNEHATAYLEGEMSVTEAQDYIKRTDETTMVRIMTSAKEQPSVLFCGVVSNVGMEMLSEYAVLRLALSSTSVLTDVQKKSKSYQNTAKSYQSIMKQTLGSTANVSMAISDTAIGKLIVQYQETDWEFCKRMASKLRALMITTVDTEIPEFIVGIPQRENVYDLSKEEMKVVAVNAEGTTMVEDKLMTYINTKQYMFLGDTVNYDGGTYKVASINADLKSGMLITSVGLIRSTGFQRIQVMNERIAGKMFQAQVKEVVRDTVKVHIVDIDAEYDEDSNVYLPYSTAYSSNDGSGFYCMPSEGDYVRVFFPGNDEGQAFVASSVSVNVGAAPTDMQWTGPNGKQILLAKEGIYITTNATESGNARKIFIDLTDDLGINIKCDKDINICAKNNLSVISNNNIYITAKNDILLSTAESFIDINANGIELGGENVVIK